MNLYLLTQTELRGPDTYDSAVVAASNVYTARHQLAALILVLMKDKE